ncbi:hypothetical protein L1987_17586 [Smallanthus sonchifolius]|uniref:Uncharacterized protein n=1 Tax=Smallanthus sonchifolius TaxID=185202 RepID=A0ACB9IXB3_9ASTR|nr:hypothetical protein L1987_17586 [Smallanthus sonchifolius]
MDNKVELFVQQYEQFNVGEHEQIDKGYARFNIIFTSLKALGTTYTNKNYVRKFFRALHPRWRAKVMTIEESKDLNTLQMDELIGNLKVNELIMEKDDEISKGKMEKNLANSQVSVIVPCIIGTAFTSGIDNPWHKFMGLWLSCYFHTHGGLHSYHHVCSEEQLWLWDTVRWRWRARTTVNMLKE